MKANLSQNEPKVLPKWKDIYSLILKSNKERKKYVLHDGPPYANGRIHMGHCLNKVLKDIVVKYKTQRGFFAPFIPGWDCHGLPVELKLLEELNVKKGQIDQKVFRKKAKDFALKYVDLQRKDFIRLGIWGDWDNPYLTLDPKYEAKVLEVLAKLVDKGYIYRGLRPVNWCIECTTALAEAEVEYNDKISDSIYVRFGLPDHNFKNITSDNIDIVVWTTTPWTLISNVAIAVHPDLDYVLVESSKGALIFAPALADPLKEKFLNEDFKVLKKFKGKTLEGLVAIHPFLERESKVILADFVSSTEGSGCVHIAPGHGEEDFQIGRHYKLETIMPLDEEGFFRDAGKYSGCSVKDINATLIAEMKKNENLLLDEKITHSYPHCWRCKNPLIFRTTEQWFLNVEHKNLRKRLLDNIEKVIWVPQAGRERISSMVSLRPDWCLSRQRLWGVPIPAIRCKECKQVILNSKLIMNLSKLVEEKGCDIWFDIDVEKIAPSGLSCQCGRKNFEKLNDILDVWFESGASFYSVVKDNAQLAFPSDLYLEGSDQHRGWFQVSLIPSVALDDTSPFKCVLTHGFVVDGQGRKMSKSLGNVISPQDIMKNYGAEILRLWVSFSDYSEDIRLSEIIIKQLIEAYRKIRNTIRFMLANLYDFDYQRDLVSKENLLEVDALVLSRTAFILEEIEKNYDNFLVYKVYQKIYDFCNIYLSSFYLDILKDRLYTFSPNSLPRRSAQTALWYILNFLIKSTASLLSFTAEEAYAYFQEPDKKESVFLSAWPVLNSFRNKALETKFTNIFQLRVQALKALEEKRAENVIGSSLEAEVTLEVSNDKDFQLYNDYTDILREMFIVSQVVVKKADSFTLKIEKAEGTKCPRCWNWRKDIGKDSDYKELCLRCAKALKDSKYLPL